MEHNKAYCTRREIIPQCSWPSTPTAMMEPKKRENLKEKETQRIKVLGHGKYNQ